MGFYRKYRGWTDDSGKIFRFRKPDGWPIDTKCPDGFTCNGYRQVDKNFRIRFGGSYWTHAEWSYGLMVYVGLCDPWGAQIWTVPVPIHFTPDNIADDAEAFTKASNDTLGQQYPENVGDWNARKPK